MSAVEPNDVLPDQNTERGITGGGDGGGSVRRWGRLGGIGAALGMSAVFAVAAWYALQRSDMQPEESVEIPMVKAEPGPVKEKPKDPGGLKIPNQDKLVYERITPKPQTPVAEKLAPAPEEPIVKTPEEPKPAEAQAGSSAASNAPAAPDIAKPATKATEDMVKSAAAEKPVAKADMKSTAQPKSTIAAAEKHAAPPAIPSTAPKAESAKTESLLPAADKAPKAAVPADTAKKKAPVAPAIVKKDVVEKAVVKKATAAEAVVAKTVAPKAVVAKTDVAKTGASGYRIQLASYRRANMAERAWKRLQKAHGEILGGLSGHTARADLGKRGVYFRLQAGFFSDAASARAACGKLRAKKQDCIIVPPKK